MSAWSSLFASPGVAALLETPFALSGLVVIRQSSNVLCALTALPSLNAGREILRCLRHIFTARAQTPIKNYGAIAGQNQQRGRRGADLLEEWCPRRDSNARPLA